MTPIRALQVSMLLLLVAPSGCATAPTAPSDREDLKSSVLDALKQMEAEDPGLEKFLASSTGYAVFPRVGKGAYIVGGGYGRGIVYGQGAPVGFADVTQLSVGFQIGGQAFMQILAFETPRDLERFTAGTLSLAANASAVILKSGAAAATKYTDGVAVFAKPVAGAMVEASVGGQQFTYRPE